MSIFSMGRKLSTTPWITCCLIVSLLASNVQSEQVDKSTHGKLADGPLHVYVGSVSLPADGVWTVQEPTSRDGIRELYLVPTEPAQLRQLGKRMYAALEEEQTQSGRWHVQMGFEACREYALENDGAGPKSMTDFEGDKRWNYLAESWNREHWRHNEIRGLTKGDKLEGPFIHLVPAAKFAFDDPPPQIEGQQRRPRVPSDERVVLAFELRPFVDDGKHWVLYTDGVCERVDIDAKLLNQHQAKIRPIMTKRRANAANQPTIEYQLIVVAGKELDTPLRLTAGNVVLNRETSIDWDAHNADRADDDELRASLNQARRFGWKPYLQAESGGVLNVWDRAGVETPVNRNPRRNLSMFSVLGGRAAVEETLQLQNLAVTQVDEQATVPIETLKGVEVKSHPFEEMLDGQPGGSLEMAGYVPADRFFLYVGKPEAIPALLDSGAPFIASMGTTLTGNCLHYNLESRYLERLGMNRDWVDSVLASGLTSEMAIFTPDLFFIDGTDVTIVARLRSPELLKRMLGMLGAGDLTGGSILELPTGSGSPAFLALRDDLLLASTNRGELERSIELIQQEGRGSLGDSAEFRYMLTQLSVNEETRLYAYFSDPFVRRLVGPEVKIGQRRRVLAKAKMEALTAQALLARMDGVEVDSLEGLIKTGYVPNKWEADGMSIQTSGLVKSQHYGSLPRMESLPNLPLQNVTPAEAEAYRAYVENYSNYWRRFFDPIAIRLDEVGSDQLELSTFILPLVDNSIYNGLRLVLAHQDDGSTLSIPIVEPEPVLQFSMNLSEMAWKQVAGNFSEFFRLYSGASPAMLDDLGPSAHVAIFDADPIIAWGSGDIFGAFGGQVLDGNSDSMLALPVVLSMLTRPCSIMVETAAPERTKQYLRQAATANVGPRRSGGFLDTAVSFYQVEDRDQWVWTMDIVGMVKLRYGVEVAGKYLVIRNIPWSSEDRVVSVVPAELNAATLQANPAACKEQLPGLFAAASDANRRAVMSGLGRLYPFMLSGAKSVEEAETLHQRLYGFYPKAIGNDRWNWTDYRMTSEQFGHPTDQRQPAFDPDEPFGLMNRIESLKLNM